MSISLNNHEDRIKSLESTSSVSGKFDLLYTFENFSDPINKTFTFNKSWSNYSLLIITCGRYVTSTVIDNNNSIALPTNSITTTDDPKTDLIHEYCCETVNGYCMFVFRNDKKSITFVETSYGRIKEVYGLKLYYNFSYNIYCLIYAFLEFLFKEV